MAACKTLFAPSWKELPCLQRAAKVLCERRFERVCPKPTNFQFLRTDRVFMHCRNSLMLSVLLGSVNQRLSACPVVCSLGSVYD